MQVATTLRRAEAKDIPAILDLLERIGGLDTEDISPEQFLVAEAQGKLIGCARLKTYGEVRELASVAVEPTLQRKGIGTAIVRRLLEGIKGPVYLVCEDDTVPFFEGLGFRTLPPRALPEALVDKHSFCASTAKHIRAMQRVL